MRNQFFDKAKSGWRETEQIVPEGMFGTVLIIVVPEKVHVLDDALARSGSDDAIVCDTKLPYIDLLKVKDYYDHDQFLEPVRPAQKTKWHYREQ